MSLHGTLETFALPDVLTLLSSTGKTGELRVHGDRVDGRVWFDGGLVVETAVGQAPTFVDGLFDLLRLTSGSFSFNADSQAPNPVALEPVAPLLEEAQGRLAEWREIEAVIPSMASGVRLVAEVGRDRVSLRDGQWRVVVAVASHRSVAEVLASLGLGEFDGCKVMKELVDAGLLAVDAAAPVLEVAPAPVPEPVEDVAPVAEVVTAEEPEVVAAEDPEVADAAAAEERDVAPQGERERPLRAPGRSRRAKAAAAAQAEAEAQMDEGDSRAMAQALVRQLASLDEVETPQKGAKGRAGDEAQEPDQAAESDEDQPGGGAESEDEPINRGLLLKFLSSVRN